MILYIDSTNYDRVTYAVFANGKMKQKAYKVDPHKSFEILQKLEEFLKVNSKQLTAISSVVVNKGPGSYTGTRIGVVHAQAISFALNIPVKFLEKEKFEKEIKKTP